MKKSRITFQDYYKTILPNLESLKKINRPILRFSETNRPVIQSLWQDNNLTWEEVSFHQNAIFWPNEIALDQELPAKNQGLYYIQNASSLLPVLALDPRADEKILDACAAPGGKALFIAESGCELTANDLSKIRMARLLKVFEEHKIPKPHHHTGNAATLFKKYPEYFDRILIDAPCSSEKHIYNSPRHLKQWSPGRIRQLKQRQVSLINGLFLALKPGGRLVYSTCAINPEENQNVIEKFLKKYEKSAQLIPYPQNLPGYNIDSKFGFIDISQIKNENLDPMFIAIIEKKSHGI